MNNGVYIGALSGTSMDTLDVTAVRLPSRNDSLQNKIELIACTNQAFTAGLRDDLLQLQAEETTTLTQATARSAAEHAALGQLFADAITQLIQTKLSGETVRAIGLHGQTLLHRPNASPPFTLQIGDPKIVAAQTGCTTVSDFRQSDLNAGGQGAPLAPAFHHVFFAQNDQPDTQSSRQADQHDGGETRVIVNIGGISNLTQLEKGGGYSGYDCGPGNILLDAWTRRHLNEAYDHDGAWAHSGNCNDALLARMLDDEFFTQAPPKSICATYFDLAWLQKKIAGDPSISPADVQASLVQLTAQCIADAINLGSPAPARVFICGGGAHNRCLMEQLQARLKMPVNDTRTLGVSPDWVEAAGFAYLAQRRLNNEATDLCSVTGACQPTVLGTIYEP